MHVVVKWPCNLAIGALNHYLRFPTMWYVDQQTLRSACAYAQSDQSLCLSLECSMNVKLLTEHHLEFLSLKEAAQARLSLRLSKCHIVRNLMTWLILSIKKYTL